MLFCVDIRVLTAIDPYGKAVTLPWPKYSTGFALGPTATELFVNRPLPVSTSAD
jgi:hypothetical protein